MTIWRMGIVCWIPKATNIHSEYVIFIAFSTTTMGSKALQCYVMLGTILVLLK